MGKIIFQKLNIQYNGNLIIENVDLDIEQGDIVCFFGPSGCGKSTLLKTALGMIIPATGKIFIDEINALSYTHPIAYVPQENELFRWLTLEQNVTLWNTESKNRSNVNAAIGPKEAIQIVGLKDAIKKMPFELSGGMARRTAIARCLATHSSLMFLDEAFISVERDLRRKIMVQIRKHIKNKKMTGLLVSHDYEEAVFVSDKIVFLTALPAKISNIVDINLPENRNIDLFESSDFKEVTISLVGK